MRTELLGQHQGLRALIEETRQALLGDDATKRPALRECIGRLGAALRAHNAREEMLLRELLHSVDAWGPARVEIMDETHVEEHDGLLRALLGATGGATPESAAEVTRVLDRLEKHMAREEEIILAENVLRDDNVVIDYIGG
jgi:predicted ThiF/HesA family dinucleotide-utilizing enzyme